MSRRFRTETFSGAGGLHEYLASVRDKPFRLGRHDCARLAAGAVAAQTGWIIAVPRRRGPVDLVTEVDRLLPRCAHVPPPGGIVASPDGPPFGWRLGVVVSDRAAFVGRDGLVFHRLRPDAEIYWSVR